MAQAQIWHKTTTTGRKEKQRIQIVIVESLKSRRKE
jgi:hypothetical protein